MPASWPPKLTVSWAEGKVSTAHIDHSPLSLHPERAVLVGMMCREGCLHK